MDYSYAYEKNQSKNFIISLLRSFYFIVSRRDKRYTNTLENIFLYFLILDEGFTKWVQLLIALTLLLSTFIPSTLTIYPKNSKESMKNLYFFILVWSFSLLRTSNTSFKCCKWAINKYIFKTHHHKLSNEWLQNIYQMHKCVGWPRVIIVHS